MEFSSLRKIHSRSMPFLMPTGQETPMITSPPTPTLSTWTGTQFLGQQRSRKVLRDPLQKPSTAQSQIQHPKFARSAIC